MQNDPLAELLRDADGDRPPPAGPADLANRVRRRARRGRVARGVLAAGLLAVVVGGASFWHRWLPAEDPKTLSLVTSRDGERTTVPVNIADLKREFARLNADAELHQRTVERILARQRSVARSTGAEVVDADDALKAQLERSALTLVNRGDNLLHDPRAKAEAVESFRRVLELFPQSRGAALARERLNQIGA